MMMNERISDQPDLVKVNKSYVVNTNDDQYNAALLRRKTHKRFGTLEERVSNLEDMLQRVLNILQPKET
jgi:hypothetical protein